MLSLKTTESMRLAIEACPFTELKRLLTLRLDQLSEGNDDVELGDRLHILIVEASDRLCQIETELGFTPLTNLVDGSHYGDPDFMPSWEWMEVHKGWIELAFIMDDEGFAIAIFIERSAGTDRDLLACCYEFGGDTEPF